MEEVKFITADGDVAVGSIVTRSPDCSKVDPELRSVDNAVFAAGAAFMYNAVCPTKFFTSTCFSTTAY